MKDSIRALKEGMDLFNDQRSNKDFFITVFGLWYEGTKTYKEAEKIHQMKDLKATDQYLFNPAIIESIHLDEFEGVKYLRIEFINSNRSFIVIHGEPWNWFI